ncbi:hypothetical protein INR49_020821 [Caranx melampygus]|nr:hypothetical protein INR49_020821 [Caranx melampygus]
MAYVSHQDLRRLSVLREQTVMVVKAPEESTLEVSAPTEHRIQVHMKGSIGPITVLTSDIGTGDVEVGEKSSCFITLEESRSHEVRKMCRATPAEHRPNTG